MPDELTPRQVADELDVTVRTVQRWIADGRLPATRVGSRVRVSRSSLSAVAEGAPSAAQPAGPIRTLLVANRGEIAARIARTAHRLGMRVIGIHAPDDRPPTGTDEAHEVPAYLDGEAILAVAARVGADAIHPGYGFLAENPDFARDVATAGLRWVGPPAEAIAAMGDKAEARRRAAAHGVPTVPGYDGAEQDDATLAAKAERVGYPLLVKPSAGGGGKGMRVVREPGELTESLAAARREAHRSFGDDRLILERYLEGARHVEVQVLFDGTGRGRPPRRARLLGAAAEPEDRRGVAGTIGHAGAPRPDGRCGAGGGRGRGLRQCRDGRDAPDRHGRVLLPRDEHASPGRAPGDRGRHRARPRGRPARDRGGRDPGRPRSRGLAVDERPRSRGAALRRGPRVRLPSRDRSPRARSLARRRPDRHRRGGGRRHR